MLNICSDSHEEICYEGDRFMKCPACELNSLVYRKDKTIDELEEEIEKLKEK